MDEDQQVETESRAARIRLILLARKANHVCLMLIPTKVSRYLSSFSLHWLPVTFRIDFKILLFTFKAIYDHAPGYLIDLIAIKEQPRYNLRSASGLILKYPSLKLKETLGDRAFSSAAPNLWNNLPLHIRLEDNFERFKSLLKTHLFRLAFDM